MSKGPGYLRKSMTHPKSPGYLRKSMKFQPFMESKPVLGSHGSVGCTKVVIGVCVCVGGGELNTFPLIKQMDSISQRLSLFEKTSDHLLF